LIGHTLTILLKTDNLFDSGADALVNAVNCVGVMGGGIALEFKNRYPEMFRQYALYCERGFFRPGVVMTYQHDDGKYVINYPTKDDWRNPSRLSYVIKGFDSLLIRVKNFDIKSVAIPALGCGLGGLDWNEVRPILYALNDEMPNVTWMIYPPQ